MTKGYLLGKLFAQLEREGAVEMRAYQLASTHPTQVIVPAFTRLAELGKTDAIVEVMNELPQDAFSVSPLAPDEQAEFPLGYYHEKARGLRASGEHPDEEEAFTAQLLVRLEPSLKKWAIEHGGSRLVRSLLRTERERLSQ